MNNEAPDSKPSAQEPPAPEVLQAPASSDEAGGDGAKKEGVLTKQFTRSRTSYRPSNKATLFGLVVVVIILIINGVGLFFVLRANDPASKAAQREEVTLSTATLDKLGMNKTAVGDKGTELVVGPDSQFRGSVVVAGDASVAGQLKLNSKFSANDASLAKLEAGNTTLGQVTVNGDVTANSLTLRKDLIVAGATKLQGSLTVSQLLTVNNNLNVVGNLAVGGTLTARSFQANSLTSDTTLTIGGHIVTRGATPGVSAGSAVGSNGTVSISGNDTSGTIAVNTGTGAGNGVLAQVSFANRYPTTPHVVVTAVGAGMGSIYVNRTTTGFTVGVNGAIPPAGFAIDYVVMQ